MLDAGNKAWGSAVVISVDEYQRLATGMTYEQCVEIIGAPGEKAEVGVGWQRLFATAA